MRRFIKNNIVGFILGAILFGAIGVVAYTLNANQVSYTPSDKTWKVKTVEEAINDMKENGTSKKVCTKVSGTDLAVGSKYECNPSLDGTTKYNFYVLRVDGNAVKLIMERNISDTVGSARTMNWQTAMDFFRSGAGKSLNWKTQVELPRVQDISDAVGNTSWKTTEKDYNGWFCLATKKQDYNADPWCGNQSAQNYLYDYTRECSNWGCSNSLDSNYAYGYWTGDMVSKQLDTTARAWRVGRFGDLGGAEVSHAASHGVRPVITISKSNIS